MPATSPEWVTTLAALATPVIAVAGAGIALANLWIARQQKVIANEKLRNDLFQRRYDAYRKIQIFLSIVGGSKNDEYVELEGWEEFLLTLDEAKFLYSDKKVIDYMDEMRNRAFKIFSKENVELSEMEEFYIWFRKQRLCLIQVLAPHLSINAGEGPQFTQWFWRSTKARISESYQNLRVRIG